MVMNRGHFEEAFAAGFFEISYLNHYRNGFHNKHAADNGKKNFVFGHDGDGSQQSAERQRTGVSHEDFGFGGIEPKKAETAADNCGTEDGNFTGSRNNKSGEMRGNGSSAGVSNQHENGKTANQQTGSEAVEAVTQIDRIGGAGNDNHGEGDIKPAEIERQITEIGNCQAVTVGFRRSIRNDGRSNQCGRKLENKLHTGGHGIGRLFGDFDVVVNKSGGAVNEQNQQADPDEIIVQISPKQRTENAAAENKQSAHGGGSFFCQQMALRTVFADRLSFALVVVKKFNQPRTAGKGNEQCGEKSGQSPQRNRTEEI